MAARVMDPGELSDAAIVSTLGLRGPAYLAALQAGDAARRIALWLDVGEALGAMGRWDRARLAWQRGRALAEASLATRGQAASFYWRLGQLAEGEHQLSEASGWYERAADFFAREGALADEAVVRMAMARIAFHYGGAGQAWQPAREAVLAAKNAGDVPSLLGETLELAGEIALDLGQHEEATASFRDAARQHALARASDEGGAGATVSSAEVRATVALAEALLEGGQVLAAVKTYEAIEGFIEAHDALETRGRGLGLLGLIKLELGKPDEAVEPLKQAHDWLEAAGAFQRRARLYVATAQRIERLGGADPARESFERAWIIARRAGDRMRMAPIGYALARCYLTLGELVRADEVLVEVLRHVQDIGDLDGLERCAELGIRIAVRLAQGKIALERLLLLARTRGRMGDKHGELRTLRSALEASLRVPDLEPLPIATEFVEALRRGGTAVLGPSEGLEIAEGLGKAELFPMASEVAQLEAERHFAAGRRGEGARTLVRAAAWSLQAGERWTAVDLWDRAIDVARELGMPELEGWSTDRTWAAER